MNSLTKRFMALFTEAEKMVASAAGRPRDVRHGFASNLAAAVQKDGRIRRFNEELAMAGEVRNLLSHRRFKMEYPAAPSQALLEALERAVSTLKNPPKVVHHFKPAELIEFAPHDSISQVLAYTSRHNYSQVLVRQDGKLDLLSSNTIHRWLARWVGEELVELTVPISEVLKFREPKRKEVRFAGRNTDLFEALSLFQGGQADSLLALVITERGKAEEKPLAFVTPWDLGELARILDGVA